MGIALSSPNTNYFAAHARKTLIADQLNVLALIEPSLLVIDAMTTQIKSLDKSLALLADEKYPVTKVMRQITGVGVITSLSFVLAVD